MNLEEINDKLDKINNMWEHYKSVNDARVKEIEQKGSADPLTEEQLSKISNEMDEQKAKLQNLELSLMRPNTETKSKNFDSSINLEYKNAFNNYLRKGVDAPLANLEIKANLTSDIGSSGSANGGYFLAPNMQKIIIGEMQENCVMRKLCSAQEISTSSLDVIDDTSFETAWNTETGTVSETSSATISRMSIPTHDLIAQPQVTQKLIDDASINIEEWLAYRLADQFIKAEETAFISGSSENNQPNGILKYAAGESSDTIDSVTSASATAITTNEILNLFYSLKSEYVNRASFLMARTTVQEIRKLQDPTSKHYLWQPAVLAGQDDMLLGCPVYQSTNIDAIAANKAVVILGDFKQYQIVDRVGIRILRDPYTAKPYIRFYTTKRVGGDVLRKEAFKVLRIKAA